MYNESLQVPKHPKQKNYIEDHASSNNGYRRQNELWTRRFVTAHYQSRFDLVDDI